MKYTGLKPQHSCGVQLMSEIFQSELQGNEVYTLTYIVKHQRLFCTRLSSISSSQVGSKEILFHPSHENEEETKTFVADTKTAGYQTSFLLAHISDSLIKFLSVLRL